MMTDLQSLEALIAQLNHDKLCEALQVESEVRATVFNTLGLMLQQNARLCKIIPVYEDICQRALEKFTPIHCDDTGNRLKQTVGKPIVDYTGLQLAADEVATEISEWHKAAMAKAGFVAEGADCVFDVARQCLAERAYKFALAMLHYTKVNTDKLEDERVAEAYLEFITTVATDAAKEAGCEISFFVAS
jgi:hypothetical protein